MPGNIGQVILTTTDRRRVGGEIRTSAVGVVKDTTKFNKHTGGRGREEKPVVKIAICRRV